MNLIFALDKDSIVHRCRQGHLPTIIRLVAGFGFILLFTSCNSKKYLQPGQSFLFANKTSIKSKSKIPNKSDLYEDLITLYRQPATKVVFGIPRHVFYYHYIESLQRHPGRKKWSEERLIKNRPVIYDSIKAVQTVETFEHYVALRGYRFAKASFKAKTTDTETRVTYKVDPGPRMYIDSFAVIADDPVLQHIIDSVPNPDIITAGSPLDIELYNLEKARIVRLIQNHGYATFDETYISQLEVDTSFGRVKTVMRVLNPSDSTNHLRYYVGSVTIYPDYDPTISRTYFDTVVNQIHYELPDSSQFTLKPEAIQRNMYLYPGHLTRREDLDKTIKNLSRIDIVKFVTPNYYIDSSDINKPLINYTFYISRNKKIDLGANTELTYSNIASKQRRSLLGTSVTLDYRDLNTFHSAEVFNLNAESGVEFNFINRDTIKVPNLVNSFNLGLNSNLTFPRFMDPLRIYHMIGYHKNEDPTAPIQNRLRRWLIEDAVSRLGVGYNFVTIRNLYQYFNINSNLAYIMQPDANRKLTIDRLGFDLFVPDAKPAFDTILQINKFQRESFGKQLYTGFIFRDYLAEYNSNTPGKPGYHKFLHTVEVSGLEVLLLNLLSNAITGKVKAFGIVTGKGENRDTILFSHFIKGEIDWRYYRDLGRKRELALRFNAGLAVPYKPLTPQVPYLKQFFVGGALSNRAWQVRELGPGAYEDTLADPNLPFYQTGDVKIDMTAEFRFKLFWYFYSAVFVDAANVWALNRPKGDPAKFRFDTFYKQFGIGYGYGLRLDFDFFIFRFDLGYKLYSPFKVHNTDGSYTHLMKDELKKFPGGFEPQIAVGQKF